MTCSRMARPVDWSSTTITVFCAEGRTRTCALAIHPPSSERRSRKSLRSPPRTVQQACPAFAFFAVRLVPEERLELSWCRHRRILSPLRLPVPPFRPCVRVRASAFPGKNYNPPGMLVSEFDYALPEALIAQRPAARRTASRLLRLEAASGAI